MKLASSAFLAGFLFSLGLGVAGMTLPGKVIDFLDITGAWDASLAFVMVGAIAVHALLFRVIVKRPSPVFASMFQVPTRRDLNAPLVLGSALFGVGWGLGGYCPGPGITSLVTLRGPVLIFVAAMAAGMVLHRLGERLVAPAPKGDEGEAAPTP